MPGLYEAGLRYLWRMVELFKLRIRNSSRFRPPTPDTNPVRSLGRKNVSSDSVNGAVVVTEAPETRVIPFTVVIHFGEAKKALALQAFLQGIGYKVQLVEDVNVIGYPEQLEEVEVSGGKGP